MSILSNTTWWTTRKEVETLLVDFKQGKLKLEQVASILTDMVLESYLG